MEEACVGEGPNACAKLAWYASLPVPCLISAYHNVLFPSCTATMCNSIIHIWACMIATTAPHYRMMTNVLRSKERTLTDLYIFSQVLLAVVVVGSVLSLLTRYDYYSLKDMLIFCIVYYVMCIIIND